MPGAANAIHRQAQQHTTAGKNRNQQREMTRIEATELAERGQSYVIYDIKMYWPVTVQKLQTVYLAHIV